ncbi:MAG: ABC transporter substrate-binding protein [Acidobacteriota bacterium]|nr:ABC transporter substrate-binding protein [Acidobacteriota bacterium]MDH3524641.1 ABC transporter substrate-binding protein [Acidobacteriota bacterium]
MNAARLPGPRARRRGWPRVLPWALPAWALLASGAVPAAAQEGGLASCARIPPADLRGICERQVLRVARYGGERPPFFYREDGAWVGFDVDLGRDMAARLGVRYAEDTEAASFDEVVAKVAGGGADVAVSKLSATLERAMQVRFSRPYLTVYQAILVNRLAAPRASDPFRDLDAPKYTIGALAGSAYVGYARNTLARAQVRPYDDFDTMMDDVVAGRLYAVLMDSARANTWRRTHSDQLIQVRTTIDKSRRDPLAIAVGWQDTHLVAWVDLYLDTIRADGTAEQLYARWFGGGEDAAAAPAEQP